ncbi:MULTISPECIES: flagellar assembly peptidoglycan hydrolase FlgJ [unclassified Cupriavidus]|uniref:flagellar assembly peptidoglycan hydrolase FlgJ n=1 Tax=Cupriavidus sp. H19C3 TaxID=3241603 RepID=UPI003BF7DAA6
MALDTSAGDISQRFALDTQGFEALKNQARAGNNENTLKAAAKQFEAVFTQMVLKSMRDATPQDGMFDSEQTKLYMSMMDQQLSQQLSARGIGLADAMYRQLARAAGVQVPQTMATMQNGVTGAQAAAGAQNAQMAAMLDSRGATDADGPAPATPPLGTILPGNAWSPTTGIRQYQAAGEWQGGQSDLGQLPDDSPAHISEFVNRMAGPAMAASRASGVPAKLIVGQAALESGWGRREIAYPDGSTTHNVFGIKAGANWRGPVAEVMTTEYVDGQPQKVRARFRAYGSYEEACADYARLLTTNPRYAGVVAANTADEAAHGLQRAGYATDPAYGEKLVRIMKKVSG